MRHDKAFRPDITGAGVKHSASTSASAAVAMPTWGVADPVNRSVRIVIEDDASVAIKFGASDVAAPVLTGADMVLVKGVEVFTIPPGVTHFRTIASAAADLFLFCGEGL
jgi:hypothetical protein